ncbi:hypothetical protein FIBSPDRAFT_1036714 [Athelia psychrophila]|uniref:Uncharacterized protein n=1 Tax=Athelia psychrophila TaxID=1759441 RepID=A0A166VC01_9AGAM|nr:hypothetical protein FIBSPDRAFT_1036714 [Fibularhizoctonia sp. CBS 109695]
MSSGEVKLMNILEMIQAFAPEVSKQSEALSRLAEDKLTFDADSLLKVIAGVGAGDIGPRRSRQAVKEYFLKRVKDKFNTMHQTYKNLLDQYHQHLDHDPSQVEKATHEAYTNWFKARQTLVEASMASRYFHYMLVDLERSQRAGDMMTMNVPKYAATMPSDMHPSEYVREQANIRRTYHSVIPAILRALPDEASISANFLSLPDLADRLSTLHMADQPREDLQPSHDLVISDRWAKADGLLPTAQPPHASSSAAYQWKGDTTCVGESQEVSGLILVACRSSFKSTFSSAGIDICTVRAPAFTTYRDPADTGISL